MINNMDEEEWKEVISFYAKRGDTEMIKRIEDLLKQITEEYYEMIDDPNYETEESISSEEEEEDYHEEVISVKMDGDFLYCE
jgi:Txe/YoeB family toxin of Txe-Axe toxin-antitoxin module